MRQVYLISSKSKDNRTKIGAILVRDNRIISSGYNGFCRKLDDSVESRYERPKKYSFFEHAERNAVYDCARRGVSTEGSTCVTNGIPCADCARGLIQAGIKSLLVHKQHEEMMVAMGLVKWIESAEHSIEMFKELLIPIQFYDKVLGVRTLMDGKIIDL